MRRLHCRLPSRPLSAGTLTRPYGCVRPAESAACAARGRGSTALSPASLAQAKQQACLPPLPPSHPLFPLWCPWVAAVWGAGCWAGMRPDLGSEPRSGSPRGMRRRGSDKTLTCADDRGQRSREPFSSRPLVGQTCSPTTR